MARSSSGIEEYTATDDVVEAKLYGFAVNSAELAPDHKAWLKAHVVPVLACGGSVTVVGEASRTGKASYNQRLSERRASSAVSFVKTQAAGRGCATAARALDAEHVGGVGESAAKQAGQRDGTEDGYYRAVLLRAWHESRPPKPPEKGTAPVPAPTVKRVIERHWSSTSHRTPTTGSPLEDGSGGEALAKLIKQIWDTSTKGGSDSRKYAKLPAGHVVVEVHVHEEINTDIGPIVSPVSSLLYQKTVRYRWGKPTSHVKVVRTSLTKRKGMTQPTRSSSTVSYPRSEVWRYVTSPTAKVFGG